MLITKRIKIKGTDIYISKTRLFGRKVEEYLGVINFDIPLPTINVFEKTYYLKHS